METAREIVDPASVGTALAVVSGAAALCAGIGAAVGRGPARRRAALAGGAGAILFPLWLVYNFIENRYGLDSVAALLCNLALFLAVGIGGGLAFRAWWPRAEGAPAEPDAADPAA